MNLKGRTRSNFIPLAVRQRIQGLIIRIDDGALQFLAALCGRFEDRPEIRGSFIVVIRKVQRQNKRILAFKIRHDARTLVKKLIVIQLDQIGVSAALAAIFAAGGKAEQHNS